MKLESVQRPELDLVVVHLGETEFGLPFLIPKQLGWIVAPGDARDVFSFLVEAAPRPEASDGA